MRLITLLLLTACLFFSACKESIRQVPNKPETSEQRDSTQKTPELATENPKTIPPPPEGWTDVGQLIPNIVQDIRYATDNNFIGQQIYDCPRCWLRPDVAAALAVVQKELEKENLGLKVFDCYRPRPMQQRLWDAKPDKRYVTPPTKGSMHNRGAAVDLTIVDANGEQLDMGTTFDFFGKEAWHEYQDHPAEVLENRKKLKSIMEANGFRGIRTEWWHYAFVKGGNELSEELWPCE